MVDHVFLVSDPLTYKHSKCSYGHYARAISPVDVRSGQRRGRGRLLRRLHGDRGAPGPVRPRDPRDPCEVRRGAGRGRSRPVCPLRRCSGRRPAVLPPTGSDRQPGSAWPLLQPHGRRVAGIRRRADLADRAGGRDRHRSRLRWDRLRAQPAVRYRLRTTKPGDAQPAQRPFRHWRHRGTGAGRLARCPALSVALRRPGCAQPVPPAQPGWCAIPRPCRAHRRAHRHARIHRARIRRVRIRRVRTRRRAGQAGARRRRVRRHLRAACGDRDGSGRLGTHSAAGGRLWCLRRRAGHLGVLVRDDRGPFPGHTPQPAIPGAPARDRELPWHGGLPGRGARTRARSLRVCGSRPLHRTDLPHRPALAHPGGPDRRLGERLCHRRLHDRRRGVSPATRRDDRQGRRPARTRAASRVRAGLRRAERLATPRHRDPDRREAFTAGPAPVSRAGSPDRRRRRHRSRRRIRRRSRCPRRRQFRRSPGPAGPDRSRERGERGRG